MRSTHLERQAVHWGVLLLPILVGLGTLLLFAEVIRPFFSIIAMFFVAWILAFLLDAIVSWILAKVPTLPRGLLAALVFIIIVVLLIVSLVLVASSVLSSLTNILGDTDSVEEAVARLVGPLQQQIDSWGIQVDLVGAVDSAVTQLQTSGQAILDEVLSTSRRQIEDLQRRVDQGIRQSVERLRSYPGIGAEVERLESRVRDIEIRIRRLLAGENGKSDDASTGDTPTPATPSDD